MGERKGQNKYYPPDYDPNAGGLNKFLGTHALRERAKKIHLGILIIRFEMPYNIWCEGCKNHIGMGVRYNAEKSKVGMYYSTPVYQFRMKCHLCDNYIVMKTDPGNLDYEIVSGARRQEKRWEASENGQIVADTKETQRRLFDDPMYKLEHVANDTQKSEDSKPRLFKLYERNHYVWDDDYMANSKLRAEFRTQKKELKAEADRDSALLQKSSLNIELLPESDQDARLAAMMRLHSAKNINENECERRNDIYLRPALPSATITTFGGLRSERILSNKLSKRDLGIVSGVKREAINDTVKSISFKKSKPLPSDGDNPKCPETGNDLRCKNDNNQSTESTKQANSVASISSLALVSSYNSSSTDNDSD